MSKVDDFMAWASSQESAGKEVRLAIDAITEQQEKLFSICYRLGSIRAAAEFNEDKEVVSLVKLAIAEIGLDK